MEAERLEDWAFVKQLSFKSGEKDREVLVRAKMGRRRRYDTIR